VLHNKNADIVLEHNYPQNTSMADNPSILTDLLAQVSALSADVQHIKKLLENMTATSTATATTTTTMRLTSTPAAEKPLRPTLKEIDELCEVMITETAGNYFHGIFKKYNESYISMIVDTAQEFTFKVTNPLFSKYHVVFWPKSKNDQNHEHFSLRLGCGDGGLPYSPEVQMSGINTKRLCELFKLEMARIAEQSVSKEN
jgi:hypothetical protein